MAILVCGQCDKYPAMDDDYLCKECRQAEFPLQPRAKVGNILDLAVQANADQPSHVVVFAHQEEDSPWVIMRIGILDLTQFNRINTVEVKLEYAIWATTGAVHEMKYGEVEDEPIHPAVYLKCFRCEDPWNDFPHSSGRGNWDLDDKYA